MSVPTQEVRTLNARRTWGCFPSRKELVEHDDSAFRLEDPQGFGQGLLGVLSDAEYQVENDLVERGIWIPQALSVHDPQFGIGELGARGVEHLFRQVNPDQARRGLQEFKVFSRPYPDQQNTIGRVDFDQGKRALSRGAKDRTAYEFVVDRGKNAVLG